MHLVITANRRKAAEFLASTTEEGKNHPQNHFDEVDLENMLQDIPIQNKSDLIDYADEHRDSFLENAVLFSETSGTTGKPLQTPRGNIELRWNTQNQMYAYSRLLKKKQDRVAIIHPGMLSPFIEATTFALKKLEVGYVKVFPIEGICDYRRIRDVLVRYEITTLMTTPSLALKILYEIKKLDEAVELKLNKVLLTGELITEACEANFKKILGSDCKVVAFVYGGSETASLMYGIGNGQYLPFHEDFIFEIVDGEVTIANPEEYMVKGELHVTWLKGGLLPIKRYNTNDVFEVTVRKNHPFKFKPLGRIVNLQEGYPCSARLEEVIYSLEQPVFNYVATCSRTEQSINIDLIALGSDQIIDDVRLTLAKEFPNYKITVRLNVANDPFMQFAAKPKLTRYTIN
ncbi:hypothetical protein [Pseudomonas brassicacearum]|uniref:hypothetical protein n=1 Tax=Pseudomonas brassicacearum TaxID=930166 RepID=UPI001DD99C1B|nr:hypothetical protein [Pseudomonas brassicacearum]CAH0131517.1 hypothetical protein SRABI06_00243 [Pseudomonas brassicacearum]